MKIYTEADVKTVQVGKYAQTGYSINNAIYDKPLIVTFKDGVSVNADNLMNAIDSINQR